MSLTKPEPKKRWVSMDRDDVAWEQNDKETDAWVQSLRGSALHYSIAELINKHRPGKAVELHKPIKGGYNIFYRLEYKDGSSAGMRIPIKGSVRFPEEKTRYEVAIMRCIAAKTTIPVPKIYHFGTAAENPTGLGPFIIMEYIEHERTMFEAMADPADQNYRRALDPDISEQKLEFLYRQMANILLQLSTVTFPRIGSVVEDEDGQFSVSGRPLIPNMNNLMEYTGMTPALLPSQPYSTPEEWYSALADMHLAQLTFQHNDAVEDETDAREKYVARQLFRQLASDGSLTSGMDLKKDDNNQSVFPIFSPDLRPSNVLIDKDLRVVGVIDWEFAYAAPAQFSFDPPWWLILKTPDIWPSGYGGWMKAYEPRLGIFLRVLEDEEKKMRDSSEIDSSLASLSLSKDRDVALSQRMRESWESSTWLINCAVQSSWEFDCLYWNFVDISFFGPNEEQDYGVRLGLLTEKKLEAMEPFVKMKMEESKERILVKWDDDDAAAHLAKFMV
ncbi:phosphotransferase family protein [Xylaria intraflava]|nr:phosphotransferase family protein [Xylaria intraflava]